MRVAFDGRSLLNPWTGIQYYLLELVTAIKEIDSSIDIVFYQDPKIKVSKKQRALVEQIPGTNVYYKSLTKVFLNRLLRKESNLFQLETDIFHETDIYQIPTKGNGVITVHDVIPCLYPDYFPADLYWRFMGAIKHNLAIAARIVADSQATKDALSFFFNIPKEKISVIYAGVSAQYSPVKDKKRLLAVQSKYGLPDKYIMFLGTIEPRKNIKKILKAYSKIVKDLKDIKLVICGGYGWKAEDVYVAYEELGLKDNVIFTGYIDKEDKAAIYSKAKAFVFPSIFEGFGLPPLEAMACGVPVIASSNSSLPEVVGNSGILVSHKDEEEIAAAILKLVNDEGLNRELGTKSIERSKLFSWEDTASKFIELYKDIMDN